MAAVPCDGENIAKDSPIQIVDFQSVQNRTSKLKFMKRVLTGILEPIWDIPLHVISIAGASRQGKSFLLTVITNLLTSLELGIDDPWRQLLQDDQLRDGFKFQNGVNRLTVGFWIWSKPFLLKRRDGSEIAVLILDTQGVFDHFTTKQDWSMIVGLSLLTSNTVIYNLMNNMQEDTLTVLNTFMEFGMLSLQEGDIEAKPFQRLIFLIRDWNIPQSFPYGAVGGHQFIQQKLEPNPSMARDSISVRASIKSCFEECECFLLPHPGQRAIQNNFAGKMSELDDNFKSQLKILMDELLNPDTLKQREIQGNPVMGRNLLDLFEKFVAAFNSIKLPDAKSLLELTVEASLEAISKQCTDQFQKELEKSMKDVEYMQVDELKGLFNQLSQQTVQQFEQMTQNISQAKLKKRIMGIMMNELIGKYHKEHETNKAKKSQLEDALLQSGKDIFSNLMIQLLSQCPLLPHQFEEARVEAEQKVSDHLRTHCGHLRDDNFHAKILAKVRPDLIAMVTEFKSKNNANFAQQQAVISQVVITLLDEYRNLLHIAKMAGNAFTRTRLQEVHHLAESTVLGKLSTQLSTQKQQLAQTVEAELKSKIMEVLHQISTEITGRQEQLHCK